MDVPAGAWLLLLIRAEELSCVQGEGSNPFPLFYCFFRQETALSLSLYRGIFIVHFHDGLSSTKQKYVIGSLPVVRGYLKYIFTTETQREVLPEIYNLRKKVPERDVIEEQQEELDKIVAKKYPDTKAFEKGIAEILVKLGWSTERAKFISTKIQVDASRGAGHAAGSAMRKAKARLRTRVPKSGINYKGYNIAVHELGHTVEQTLTLHNVDYYSLSGVPNNAFTEAFAFVFQDRDLDLLGIKQDKTKTEHLKALDIFWNAYEIMGVSLVDMKAWNWMYKNPAATPAQLKQAIISFAKEVWNKYYAPVFKIKDQSILAIYSHMIAYSLYLPDYPLGHVIQFQIENYLEGKNLGQEMERLCASGNIIPQLWMKKGVGSKITVKPLLKAVNRSLKFIKK